MTAENELDIDDYYRLPLDARYQLDEWLKSLGGDPVRTRKITRHDTYIEAEEYALDHGNFTYNWKTKDVDIRIREYKFDDGPPLWKELCLPKDDTDNDANRR